MRDGVITFLHQRGYGRIRLDNGVDLFFCAGFVDRVSERLFNDLRVGDEVIVGRQIGNEARNVRWFAAETAQSAS